MPTFLTFALVAPLAAFGDLAVGERRGSFDRPARSAVLGLVGACLGLEREDEAGQQALAAGYDLALLCEAPGALLADYHTAQVPSAVRGRAYPALTARLRAPDLNTILTRRDYRVGAWHLATLSARRSPAPQPHWPLADLAAAMAAPKFVPYLGRKSCPLGLPLAPELAEAADAPAALLARRAGGKEAAFRPAFLPAVPEPEELLLVMDRGAVPADDPRLRRVELRRDQPRNRRLWQFDRREEAVLAVPTR